MGFARRLLAIINAIGLQTGIPRLHRPGPWTTFLLAVFLSAFTFRFIIFPRTIYWTNFWHALAAAWLSFAKYLWTVVVVVVHAERVLAFLNHWPRLCLSDLREHWEFYVFVGAAVVVVEMETDGGVLRAALWAPGYVVYWHWPIVWRDVFWGTWAGLNATLWPLRMAGMQWGVLWMAFWGFEKMRSWVRPQWVFLLLWACAWSAVETWWRGKGVPWPTMHRKEVVGVYGQCYSVFAITHRAYMIWVRWTPWFLLTAFVAFLGLEWVAGEQGTVVENDTSDSSGDGDEEVDVCGDEDGTAKQGAPRRQRRKDSPPRNRDGCNIHDVYEFGRESLQPPPRPAESRPQWRAKTPVTKPVDMNQSFYDPGDGGDDDDDGPQDKPGRNLDGAYDVAGGPSSSAGDPNIGWQAKNPVTKPVDMNQSFYDPGILPVQEVEHENSSPHDRDGRTMHDVYGFENTSSASWSSAESGAQWRTGSRQNPRYAGKGDTVWCANPHRNSQGADMAASFYEDLELTPAKRRQRELKQQFRGINSVPPVERPPRAGHTPLQPLFPLRLSRLPGIWQEVQGEEENEEECWDQGEEDEDVNRGQEDGQKRLAWQGGLEEHEARRTRERRKRQEREMRARDERDRKEREEMERKEREERKRREQEREEGKRREQEQKEREERKRREQEERERRTRGQEEREKNSPDSPPSSSNYPHTLPSSPDPTTYKWVPPPAPTRRSLKLPELNLNSKEIINTRKVAQAVSMEGLFDSSDSEPGRNRGIPKTMYIKITKLYHEDDSELDLDPVSTESDEDDSDWDVEQINPDSDRSSDHDYQPAPSKSFRAGSLRKRSSAAMGEDEKEKEKGNGNGEGKGKGKGEGAEENIEEAIAELQAVPEASITARPVKKPTAGKGKKTPKAKGEGEEPTRASHMAKSVIAGASLMRPLTLLPSPSPPPPLGGRGSQGRFMTPEEFEAEMWNTPDPPTDPRGRRWRRIYLLGFMVCFLWYLVGDLYRGREDYMRGAGLGVWDGVPEELFVSRRPRWEEDQVRGVSYDTGEAVG